MEKNKKFEEIVLAICEKIPREHLATVKLNKLVWLIDKEAFLSTGKTITECKYIKRMYGPVPYNNRDMLNSMVTNKILKVYSEEIDLDDYSAPTIKFSYEGLRTPDMQIFSEEEKNIIYNIIDEYGKESTRYLINLSHDIVWATYDDKQEIPMEAYLATSKSRKSKEFKAAIFKEENSYYAKQY